MTARARAGEISKLFRLLGPTQAVRFMVARATKEPRMTLQLRGMPHTLECRPATSDIFCLWQIFGANECAVDLPDVPRVIVDAGANVGYASVSYARSYPGARIIAIEPDASNVALARENLRSYPNVTLVRGAVWARDTWVVIENPDDEPWAFRMKESDKVEGAGVPGYTVTRILADHGVDHVDLLKMDIEGGETAVFSQGPLDWLDACQVLVIEIHSERALEAVQSMMSHDTWSLERQGEKLVFTRKANADVKRAPRSSSGVESLEKLKRLA